MSATIDLNLVRAFVAVHETGSYSRAAQRLGVPRSTLSRAITRLEDALGVVLFRRTTRHVTITREGLALFERVSSSLASLESALAEVPEEEEVPSGLVRVTTTPDLGHAVVAEVAAMFARRHPGVQLEVHLGGAIVDLAREGFDLALRVSSGRSRETSLVARKVGTIRVQLYAAPGYLASRGMPRGVDDLLAHDWVSLRGAPPARLDGARTAPRPRIAADDFSFLREVLRRGGGVGALPTFLGDPDVASGALVRVFPRWVSVSARVYLVRPGHKHVPARVRAFQDLVVEMLRQRPLSLPEHVEGT